jgi:NAD(P)-dependent dehydrogenase (short-subunit alcohol dehydrogenase family)
MNSEAPLTPTAAPAEAALVEWLERLAADPDGLVALAPPLRRRLVEAAGRLSRPDRQEQRRRQRAFRRRDREEKRAHDDRLVATTEMRTALRQPVFVAPRLALPAAEGETLLAEPRACYVCKASYTRLHHFYDQLCPPCAALNYDKRFQSRRLDGEVALVTGGRVKIGYHVALGLLRAGATVVVTTRFPRDAAARFAREADFAGFRERLQIHGLDLRHLPSVERFTEALLAELPRLDHLINNAAQTVRRPPAFYRHLLAAEEAALPPGGEALLPARLTQQKLVPGDDDPVALFFPQDAVDVDLQQVDLRPHNSWRMTAAEVPTVELVEVHLVNALAPFLLVARLKPLMLRHPGQKHIVNVSAMEAQFSRKKKTDKHPHTNMAKASLNMLTRTSAADYAQDGILMHSVDTGWITDEDPFHHALRKQHEHRFHPPLDVVDGAARVLDPIFTPYTAPGLFWKDYRPTDW